MSFQYSPFTYGQISVTSSATLIKAANNDRKSIAIVNYGTTDVYIGDVNVTTSTGVLLVGIKGASVTLPITTNAIYGITGGASQTVGYLEIS